MPSNWPRGGTGVRDRVQIGEVNEMAIHATIAEISRDFGRFCDAAGRGETVIITRADGKDVALIPASELSGLAETAHLLRSPANAMRLVSAIERVSRRSSTDA
jgi:antitoxin YefM